MNPTTDTGFIRLMSENSVRLDPLVVAKIDRLLYLLEPGPKECANELMIHSHGTGVGDWPPLKRGQYPGEFCRDENLQQIRTEPNV